MPALTPGWGKGLQMGASGIALPYPNWENPTAPVRPPFLPFYVTRIFLTAFHSPYGCADFFFINQTPSPFSQDIVKLFMV